MKRTIVVLILTIFHLLSACNLKITKKRQNNSLISSGKIINCDKINIYSQNKLIKSDTLIYGEKLTFVFNEITGFKSYKGKIFPGLKLSVIDSKGKVVYYDQDLYEDANVGYPETGKNQSNLEATITLTRPIFSSGEKYKILLNFWDKKSKGTFKTEYNFTLLRYFIELANAEFNSINFSEMYLFSEKTNMVINNNQVAKGDKIKLFLDGISGFDDKNNLIYPGMKVLLSDKNNNILLKDEDLLKKYTKTGIDKSLMSDNIVINFTVPENSKNDFINLQLRIWDKNSKKFMTMVMKLIIR